MAELDPDPCPESKLEIICVYQLGRLEQGKESQSLVVKHVEGNLEDHSDQLPQCLSYYRCVHVHACKTHAMI